MGHRFQTILLSLGVLQRGTAAQAIALAELSYGIGADGRVSTDVFVNGQDPFNFALDTASGRTMLLKHLTRSWG